MSTIHRSQFSTLIIIILSCLALKMFYIFFDFYPIFIQILWNCRRTNFVLFICCKWGNISLNLLHVLAIIWLHFPCRINNFRRTSLLSAAQIFTNYTHPPNFWGLEKQFRQCESFRKSKSSRCTLVTEPDEGKKVDISDFVEIRNKVENLIIK